MSHFFIFEDGIDVRVEGTKEELEAKLRDVGLISDSDDDYNSLNEFLIGNSIELYHTPTQEEVLSVDELVDRWN